ncbi:AI-2E family transporter [Candidatus Methylobacter oryzae]|uniref:AI-2E family transporter n=1 Tax=Candidatus Methylobacter oryzae TaxID=2497749 RepID=A0ABY3C7M4_9GAMM|nr:AI-2E family transporter [Candidatus Methylobacter oryzae]TRW92061.1 AI-2E family transporter [Candidatus Methylobacter oryzae]
MTDSQKWLALVFISGLAWLVYLLAPVLMPFAFAAMLAYLGDPLTDRLETYQLSRTKAVLVVFSGMTLVFVLFLLLFVPLLEYQVEHFVGSLPAYVTWLNETVIPWTQRRFHLGIRPINLNQIINLVKSHWEQAGGIAASIMSSVSHSGGVIAEWMMNLLLIPVVTFYLLRDWDELIVKIHDLLPRRVTSTASKLAREVDTVLSAFVRGQLYVMLALGCIYSIGLWMTGLDLALLIGMLAGLVSFVPYLGSIVGIVTACIATLVQFHDLIELVPVAIVFIVGQSLEGMVLTPMLVGDKIGLHPVAVMFAVLAGGQLFGFLGILLALPVASVIMVLLRHVHDIYRYSDFYGRE